MDSRKAKTSPEDAERTIGPRAGPRPRLAARSRAARLGAYRRYARRQPPGRGGRRRPKGARRRRAGPRHPPQRRKGRGENPPRPFGACDAGAFRAAGPAGRPRKDRLGPRTRKRPARGIPPCGPSALAARATSRAKRKAPSASATPCPPAALRCSTLGEGGLNCRVRDGTG